MKFASDIFSLLRPDCVTWLFSVVLLFSGVSSPQVIAKSRDKPLIRRIFPSLYTDSGTIKTIRKVIASKKALQRTPTKFFNKRMYEQHQFSSVSTSESGMTPFMWIALHAGEKSCLSALREILRTRPDVLIDQQSERGWTALMLAARNSRTSSSTEAVRALLEAGANPDLQTREGWTALMLASHESHRESSRETVGLLLEYGADQSLFSSDGLNALQMAVLLSDTSSDPETIRMLDNCVPATLADLTVASDTLSYAVGKGPGAVRTLLSRHPPLNQLNSDGQSPLAVSVIAASKNGNTESVRLLLEAGADPDLPTAEGFSPLTFAVTAKLKAFELVVMLLDAGANPDYQDKKGFTALMTGIVHKTTHNLKALKLLINAQKDLDLKTREGITALSATILTHQPGDDTGVIRALLDAGADPGARTNDGDSPLSIAVSRSEGYEFRDIILTLADSGAPLNQTHGTHGHSLLVSAVAKQNLQICVDLLCFKNTRADLWTNSGKSLHRYLKDRLPKSQALMNILRVRFMLLEMKNDDHFNLSYPEDSALISECFEDSPFPYDISRTIFEMSSVTEKTTILNGLSQSKKRELLQKWHINAVGQTSLDDLFGLTLVLIELVSPENFFASTKALALLKKQIYAEKQSGSRETEMFLRKYFLLEFDFSSELSGADLRL